MVITKRKTYKKKCKFCLKDFVHEDKRQKFCSRVCYVKYVSRPLKIKICKFCGKDFLEDRNHHHIKFCSNSCAVKNNWKLGKYTKEIQKKMGINVGIARKGKIRVNRIKKICPMCKKEFSHVPNYARQVTFCSQKCSGKENRKYRVFPVKDTSIEVKIQNFLKELQLEFITHQYMKEIKHGYQCDILIPVQEGINQKTIIECDGDYWHGNIKKYNPLNTKQIEQIERDKIRTKELLEQGFRVIRLWEHEIKPMEIDNLKNIILTI